MTRPVIEGRSMRITRLDEAGQPAGEPLMMSGVAGISIDPAEDDADEPTICYGWAFNNEPLTLTFNATNVPIEAWSLIFGTNVVDFSIATEPHLVRGEN